LCDGHRALNIGRAAINSYACKEIRDKGRRMLSVKSRAAFMP